jgi:hypothetical protein
MDGLQCWRKWYIRRILRRIIEGKNDSFATGQGFHKVQEVKTVDFTKTGKLRPVEYYVEVYRKTTSESKDLANRSAIDTYVNTVRAAYELPTIRAQALPNGKLLVEEFVSGPCPSIGNFKDTWCGRMDVVSDKVFAGESRTGVCWDYKTSKAPYNEAEILDGSRSLLPGCAFGGKGFQLLTMAWMIERKFGIQVAYGGWDIWFPEAMVVPGQTKPTFRQSIWFKYDWDMVREAEDLFFRYVRDTQEMITKTADAGSWEEVFVKPERCTDRFCEYRGDFCDKQYCGG